MADPGLIQGIYTAAREVGARPQDLASVISYETGGTFDPWKAGPTTKWGQHRGLIQWGEPQARQYGVSASTPPLVQMQAVARYLKDHGYRPGMGVLDLYSTVNAGRPGAYGASDGYGTVATHVDKILKDHAGALARLQGGGVAAGGVQTPSGPTSSLSGLFAGPSAPPAALQSDSRLAAESSFDPLISAMSGEDVAPAAPAGPDPREAKRQALIGMIGQMFA